MAGLFGLILANKITLWPHPIPVIDKDTGKLTHTFNTFSAYISEVVGAFFFIFIFMIATDKRT